MNSTVVESLTMGAGATRYVSSSYDYDGSGLARRTLEYPNGRKVMTATDPQGRLRKVYDDGQSGDPVALYDYIGSRLLRRAMQNGVDLDLRVYSGGSPTAAAHYDAAGRPTLWTHLALKQAQYL
jgi:hypothetical protein